MIKHLSVSIDEGKERVMKMAHDLEERGYEILEIEKTLVKRGENAEGRLYYAPGYKIVYDNGEAPRYRGYWFDEPPAVVNENLIDPPNMMTDSRWLWE